MNKPLSTSGSLEPLDFDDIDDDVVDFMDGFELEKVDPYSEHIRACLFQASIIAL